jgi:hypothetical protein
MAPNNTDAEQLTRWLGYLEEDCLEPDGLLCFYEAFRSTRVAQVSETLWESFTKPIDGESQ